MLLGSRLNWFVITSLISISIATTLIIFRPNHLTIENALLAIAITVIGLLPAVCEVINPPRRRPPVPLMALTGAYYAIFFGASTFLIVFLSSPFVNSSSGLSEGTGIVFYNKISIAEILPKAQLLVLAGLSAMLAAWTLSRRYVPIPRIKITKDDYSGARYRFLLWALALTNILYLYIPGFSELPSLGQLMIPASYLTFSGFFALFLKAELSKREAIVFFCVLMPLWIVKLLTSLFLTPLILICILAAIIWYWIRGTLPWKLGLVALVIFVFVYPLQGKFRAAVWNSNTNFEFTEKASNIGYILIKHFTSWDRYKINMINEYGLTGLARRLSSITSYSHVVEQTPENVPFWLGKTYKPLFINWIPRVFWVDKPKEKVGNEFGLRYGIISPSDGDMSINLPWITEMYINFGRWGVLVGMALVGFLLGGLERAFNAPETPLPETIVGITLLLPIFYQESNFSLMMGSFLPLAVFLYFYFRIGLKWRVKEKTT